MQCMKCGRDTEADQVFCTNCKEIMKKYPVRPGTVVQLPYRPPQSSKKVLTRRRNNMSVEEQLKMLRRVVKWQIAVIVVLIAAVVSLSRVSVDLYEESEKKVLPGQNYVTATEAPETEPAGETTEGFIAG